MSIPKVIHYCWFGGNELSPLAQHCINSWKKYCPEYEIVCWNEENFDVNSLCFTKEANQEKAWAFISDYVRLFALYNHGGIYMDADFELLQNIDYLCENNIAFTGYQGRSIPAAIIGSEKGNMWIKELLDYYIDRNFILEKNKNDTETNSRIISKISYKKFDFEYGDTIIQNCGVRIYPHEYFAPITKMLIPDSVAASERKHYYEYDSVNTYGIHHFAGSWVKVTPLVIMRKSLVKFIKRVFGYKIYRLLKNEYIKLKHRT